MAHTAAPIRAAHLSQADRCLASPLPARYGSAEGYLRHIGLRHDELEAIRSSLMLAAGGSSSVAAGGVEGGGDDWSWRRND